MQARLREVPNPTQLPLPYNKTLGVPKFRLFASSRIFYFRLSLAFSTILLLICRCYELLLASCWNVSFLECSPPTVEDRVWVRAGTSRLEWRWPWSSLFIVVTPTWSILFDSTVHARTCKYWCLGNWQMLCDALQVLFGIHPGAVHVSSCMFIYNMHRGEPCCKHSPLFACSYVDVPNSSFLECLPPTVEAGLIPGQDMSVLGLLV